MRVFCAPPRWPYPSAARCSGSTHYYGIAQVPAGDGSGFQWIAVMPLGLIFLVLTFPALVCAWNGQFLWAALVLGCAGLIAFFYLWNELLSEFYHTT
jgi:hypothetical protein